MDDAFKGGDIDNARLDLSVDKLGLDVSGVGEFDNIPATLVWRENFTNDRDFQSRYLIKAQMSDFGYMRQLGFDIDLLASDYISGAIAAELELLVLDKIDSRLNLNANITQAVISAPALGWEKPKGIQGKAEITVNLSENRIVGIPEFTVTADDLLVTGSAKYALDGTGLERVDFSKIVYGRTNMGGSLISRPDGTWDAGFQGNSFDLSPIWDDILMQMSGDDEVSNQFLDGLTLAVELEKVWLDLDTSKKMSLELLRVSKKLGERFSLKANFLKMQNFI